MHVQRVDFAEPGAQRTLACIVTENAFGVLTVVIELEREVIFREPHYSQAKAEKHARLWAGSPISVEVMHRQAGEQSLEDCSVLPTPER